MAISIGVPLVTALLLAAAATATEPEGSGHQRMLAILAKIAEGDPEGPLTIFPQREARRLSLELERDGNPAFDPLELWELLFDLGQAEVKVGNVQAGISHLLRARKVLDGLDPGVRKRLDSQPIETIFHLAVAYMRLGEDQNCCMLDTAEVCILPLRGKGMHSKEEGTRNAIKYFKEVLAMPLPPEGSRAEGRVMNSPGFSYPSSPGTSNVIRYHMTARWLLNIAYMTLGGYPDNVPDQYLIDPKVDNRLPALRERRSQVRSRHLQPLRRGHRR